MYTPTLTEDDLFRFYDPYTQTGGELPYYRATYRRQRGSGIGGIFGALARKVLPFLGKHILPSAERFFKNTFADVVSNRGQNWQETVKDHGIKGLKDIGRSIFGFQSGSGHKGVKVKKAKPQKRNKRQKSPSPLPAKPGRDIFFEQEQQQKRRRKNGGKKIKSTQF
jgi:hypothetical protein